MGCAGSFFDEDDRPPRGENIFFSFSYTLGRKIGRGGCGTVYAAEASAQALRGQEYAVKVILLTVTARMLEEKHLLRSARREAVLWQAVGNHEHCVLLVDTFYEITGRYMMVMERCACTLGELLIKSIIGEPWLAKTFREMLLGIAHVHRAGIVHRDISPDNFLFGGVTRQTVKLADFGAAARMHPKRKLKGLFGTVPYMSPEMLTGCVYDERTDLWSYAACVYMVLTGDYIYSPPGEQTGHAVRRAIVAGAPEPTFVWAHWLSAPPQRAGQFVKALLERDPVLRRQADEALEMPFLCQALPGAHDVPVVAPVSRHLSGQGGQGRGQRDPHRAFSVLPGQIEELT